jgi:hypothetical protein
MKKIPKSITIRGVKIQVKIMPQLSEIATVAGWATPENKWSIQGFADTDTGIIYIDSGLSPAIRLNVFHHELAHFIEWFCGMDWTEPEVEGIASILKEIT